jgi:predicted metal-binding membrane protein
MMFPSLSSVVYLWVNFIRRRVSGKVRVLRVGLFLSGYVGVMDLPAMIGLAAVTSIEKLTPFGLQAGRLVGSAFIVTAVVISIWPDLVPIPGAYLCRVP